MKRTVQFFIAALFVLVGIWLATPTVVMADDFRPVTFQWEIAAPGANTDAITDITWPHPEALRITIQCDTSTVVNVMVDRGGTENALGLNGNSALAAGATYTFDIHSVLPGDIVNVQVETDSIIDTLTIGSLRPTR